MQSSPALFLVAALLTAPALPQASTDVFPASIALEQTGGGTVGSTAYPSSFRLLASWLPSRIPLAEFNLRVTDESNRTTARPQETPSCPKGGIIAKDQPASTPPTVAERLIPTSDAKL